MNIMDQVVEVTADAFRLAKFLAETRAAQIRGGLPLGCHVCGEHYGHRPVVFPGGTTGKRIERDRQELGRECV